MIEKSYDSNKKTKCCYAFYELESKTSVCLFLDGIAK